MIVSCNGQNKTKPQEIVNKQKAIFTGQPKLVKTQGSTQYDNVHRGLQDKAGNLWFCTTGEGVYRYGASAKTGERSFTQFTVNDALNTNTVWCVLEDKKGNLWFGTADGICFYDGKQFTRVPIVVKQGLTTNSSKKNAVWSIMQDKSGKLWFGTNDGVYCYNGQQSFDGINRETVGFTRFPDERVINKSKLHLKVIESILEDKNGKIWFGSSGGEEICCFDGTSLTNPAPMHYYGRVMNILEDKKGNLWFATANQGAVCYDGKTFTGSMKEAGISAWVYSITEDKNGNLWFATELGSGQLGEDGGVWRFDGKTFTRFTTKDGLVHNGVFCIVEDKSKNYGTTDLWFGTRNTGLCRYDGKTFSSF